MNNPLLFYALGMGAMAFVVNIVRDLKLPPQLMFMPICIMVILFCFALFNMAGIPFTSSES